MPKKKPIARRLDKLFEDIQQVDPSAEARTGAPAAGEQAPPTFVRETPTLPRAVSPAMLVKPSAAAQTETAIRHRFEAGQNDWAVLEVEDDLPNRRWTENDRLLVEQVADQLSLALENARLFQETQTRAEELAILNEASQALAATLNLNQIIEITYHGILRLFNTKNFYMALYDRQRNEIVFPHFVTESAIDQAITRLPLGDGITSYIIRTRENVLISDGTDEWLSARGETPVGESARSFLGVPMILGDEVLGALALQDFQTPSRYSKHDLNLLASFANQSAIAVQNARLFEEAQRRTRETSALAEVGREISVTLELQNVLDKIAEYAMHLLNAAASAVYVPNLDFKMLNPVAVIGQDEEEIRANPLTIGIGIVGMIAQTKMGEILNDVNRDPRAITIQGTPASVPHEHLMAVPILLQDRLRGVMAVWRVGEGREFDQTEFDFLNSLAQQAAIAMENARLFQEVAASQGQLSEALRIARIGYFEIDGKSQIITFTDELFSLLNTNSEKEGGYQFPLEQTLQEFVLAEDIEAATKAVNDAIASKAGSGAVSSEVRYKTADGRIIWVSSIYQVEHDSQGQVVKIVGSSQDITERKTNELIQIAVTQISEAALTASTVEELIKTVHAAANTLMPARNFHMALYDRKADWLTFPYYVDERETSKQPQKLGSDLTSHVIRTGKALRTTPEIYTKLEKSGEVAVGRSHSVYWIGVPLRSESAVRGVMTIQSYHPTILLTEQHKEILSLLGAQTIAAIERLTAREALARSEADLRALFASMQDVVLVIDKSTRYVRIAPTNPSRLFRPPQELLGQRMDQILPPETHEPFHVAINQALSSNEIVQIEYKLPIEDNEFWFLANISRLNENEVFWVARDITERKRAEEALQRRSTYLAASAEIGRLVTSTLDLNTIFTRTVSLIGERFGSYFAAIYIIDETSFHATLREAKGEAGEKMKTQRYTVSVGSQTMIGQVADTGQMRVAPDVRVEPLYQLNPLLLDTQSEAVIPLRVGERKIGVIDIQSKDLDAFSQDELSVLQSLADQIAIAIDNASSYERSQALIKELQELDQLKSQFLANMSHELRTPLNSIIGFSRVILKGIDGPVSDMQHQDLTAIYNSGQHLLGLINDILDLARIEAGKMELNFEEVKLAEMVNSVFSTAKGLVKEKPIQLIAKVPPDMPTVRGDTMRVRQVLINLLSNASKFTDEGSITVETSVQPGPTGKPEALIRVIDTGPGITEEGQAKLFRAFSQVDGSPTRKTGGSGLGLSICANLVQLHGGRIGVASTEGHGATFWFTLPLFNPPVTEIPADQKLILAIDDDPQVISLYERYLGTQGYFVVPLTDPTKARERILELKPYAVTLDIMMPHVDGWTVLTSLKADPATRQVPVVICSIIEQTDKGFNLGAADYLVKPILEEDLVHAINKLNRSGDIHEVLVIDDDPNDLRLMARILTEHGQYKAILAEGGRAGWEAINSKPPQAIILDIFMPEMDGFTILEKLRENPTLQAIPVLVVSGGGLTSEQHQQLADYGKRLITKGSLKEDELIASLENALQRIG